MDIIERAANLARAVVEHVADGAREAPPGVQAERERLCRECPKHDGARDACSECGCGHNPALSFVGVNLAMKRRWASSRCPKAPPAWDAV